MRAFRRDQGTSVSVWYSTVKHTARGIGPATTTLPLVTYLLYRDTIMTPVIPKPRQPSDIEGLCINRLCGMDLKGLLPHCGLTNLPLAPRHFLRTFYFNRTTLVMAKYWEMLFYCTVLYWTGKWEYCSRRSSADRSSKGLTQRFILNCRVVQRSTFLCRPSFLLKSLS